MPTTVWDCFTQRGSPVYPSEEPYASPFDTFTCKKCKKEFSIPMCGAQSWREQPHSFQDRAFTILANHLAEHIIWD
jgi:hypothetical protein